MPTPKQKLIWATKNALHTINFFKSDHWSEFYTEEEREKEIQYSLKILSVAKKFKIIK